MISIKNDGKDIIDSNFWESEYANAGYYYLSINAGAVRLLVPKSKERDLKEMKTAQMVILSRQKKPGKYAYELIFEDYSENPYMIFMSSPQVDRLIPEIENGWDIAISVWKEGPEKVLQLAGKFRMVDSIPYLKGWNE